MDRIELQPAALHRHSGIEEISASEVHKGNGRIRWWLTTHSPSSFTRKTSFRPSSVATLVTPLKVRIVFGRFGSDKSIK